VNLLVISNNPERASFRQRIAVYIDYFRSNGISCEITKLPSSPVARRRLFIYAGSFDGIFLQKKTLNFFDAFFLKRFSKKILYDFDDAIIYGDKSPEKEDRKRGRAFHRTVQLADLVLAGNDYLANLALKYNSQVAVVPTGLDICSYKLHTRIASDDKVRLVWIGSRSTLIYLAEIRSALEEIGSRFDNVVLRIICDDFFDLQNMEVEKRQWSEKTQAVDLASSDIGLAPLPDNNFTRGKCGFKILQYAAAGLPVVTSPVGVNAQLVQPGVSGFYAQDINQWIEGVGTLVSNPELRKSMGCHAGQKVTGFDVAVIGQRLYELVRKCLD
jgi:glycosyltransferase involved in cell wall biosynthesis